MVRDDFISNIGQAAEALGLDTLSRWVDIPLWRIEVLRPGFTGPVMSVHLRTDGTDDASGARLMHFACLRPGEGVSDDVPAAADGSRAPARHHVVRFPSGSGSAEALSTFRAEARRALGMTLAETHQAGLERAVRAAMADDPDMAADVVAAVMVEAGLGSRLQVSLDERLNVPPAP